MHEEERYAGIIRTTEFIEQHLQEELQLEELARMAGYSPFHFHRLFCACTGETLSQYIRERRLAYAARQLRSTDESGTRIGFDIGYGSHESFIRSFMKRFGEPPQLFRRRACTMREPRIEVRQAAYVVGVVCQTDTSKDRHIAGAWKELSRLWEQIPGKVCEDRCYGLELYEPQADARSGQFTYVAAVLVADLAIRPQGVAGYTIPGGRYAVFTHAGSTELLGETFGYIYGEWLPASGEALRGMDGGDACSFDFEFYGPGFQEGRADSELYIYVPLK